jgi:hypothetical protein
MEPVRFSFLKSIRYFILAADRSFWQSAAVASAFAGNERGFKRAFKYGCKMTDDIWEAAEGQPGIVILMITDLREKCKVHTAVSVILTDIETTVA